MNDNSGHFQRLTFRAVAVVAALMATACATQQSAPQQVQASNPTVTYQYRSDDELIQAEQRAVTFCDQYRSTPRTVNISSGPDSSRTVVFECISSSPSAPPPGQYNSNLTYNYRTDQELLDASRNAQIYCRNNGSQQVTSSIVSNSNGTKTVTFRCVTR